MADDSDAAPEEGDGKKKGGKKPLIIGAAAMVLCGAGAFAAVSMLGGGDDPEMHAGGADQGGTPDRDEEKHAEADDDGGEGSDDKGALDVSSVAFVPVDPLTVTVGQGAQRQHLRFTSQLEVPYARQDEVAMLMPRVVDALGGYLRALEPAMLADRDAHLRIRGQMLRRVKLVVGPDAVHDLLVTEFVLN